MDKSERQKLFCFETVSVTVRNGEVKKCSARNETVFSVNRNFYEVLNCAMIKLAEGNPKTFVEMYKSLYFSTREYKMAKKVYQQYGLEKF